MALCVAHEAFWGIMSEKKLSPGEGYLLGARFVHGSVIQDKQLDLSMSFANGFFTREELRLELESKNDGRPYLICNECIDALNLSQADKDAAQEAAKRFSVDNSTPGHVPGSE